jgi:chemotaxis protein histidine kinase CheA
MGRLTGLNERLHQDIGGFRLSPVACAVREFPDVVVEGDADLPDGLSGGAVLGDGRPALVVDAAVAEDLGVLGLVALGRVGVVENCRPC